MTWSKIAFSIRSRRAFVSVVFVLWRIGPTARMPPDKIRPITTNTIAISMRVKPLAMALRKLI
jgi:hypothetical protein